MMGLKVAMRLSSMANLARDIVTGLLVIQTTRGRNKVMIRVIRARRLRVMGQGPRQAQCRRMHQHRVLEGRVIRQGLQVMLVSHQQCSRDTRRDTLLKDTAASVMLPRDTVRQFTVPPVMDTPLRDTVLRLTGLYRGNPAV